MDRGRVAEVTRAEDEKRASEGRAGRVCREAELSRLDHSLWPLMRMVQIGRV